MKTQIQQHKQEARTLQSKIKAANQAPMSQILQTYSERNIQRQADIDEDDLLQGKFETAQREEFDDDELLQAKFDVSQQQTESHPLGGGGANNTGLPDNLKAGIENLSGYSMDDVQVHYNSPKPAQLQALAYTQGTDIHVAPGQEKHLPHEAWHVVQQKQGRVQPTMQLQGVNVNDNEGLEKEADVMGKKILQMKSSIQFVFGKKNRVDGDDEYKNWDTYSTFEKQHKLHNENHEGDGGQLTIFKVPSKLLGHYKVALEWYDGVEKKGKDKVAHLIIPDHTNFNVFKDTNIPSKVEIYHYPSGGYNGAKLSKSKMLSEDEKQIKLGAMDSQKDRGYVYNLFTMPFTQNKTFNCKTWANLFYDGNYD